MTEPTREQLENEVAIQADRADRAEAESRTLRTQLNNECKALEVERVHRRELEADLQSIEAAARSARTKALVHAVRALTRGMRGWPERKPR